MKNVSMKPKKEKKNIRRVALVAFKPHEFATTRVVDSHDIRDQLSVLFQREAVEDLKKMQDYYRLSGELSETIRMRDAYIIELHTKCGSNEVVESIKILRHMQLDDTQEASRLILMAREMRDKVNEKNHFVARLRLM
ncbi:hypothetical protein Tco_0609226 [Tanacetum coccineum]